MRLGRVLRHARLFRSEVPSSESPPQDLRAVFSDLHEWQAFARAHPQVRDRAYMEAIARYARVNGADSGFLGRISPHEISVAGRNYREQLFAAGLNPRQRAVMELFAEDSRAGDI